MSTNPIEEILHPRSIALVGSLGTVGFGGGWFIRGLQEFGFKGNIYPVNPKYKDIMGLKAYPTLQDIPGPVDYVISNVPSQKVIQMLEDAAQKGVKTVHLFTARFSETGRPGAVELEQEISRLAKGWGIRLIGPNCMGIHYPPGGISWQPSLPKEQGPGGLISQSGALSMEILRALKLRGVYFSKVFSYGNAIDLNECDFLEHLAHDPETKVIVLYIEGVKDGPRFINVLRQTIAVKPVIILKGGKGESGARAAASHTGSLAGSSKIWEIMVNQAGAVSADSIEELTDLATAFYFLPPVRGCRVGVVGGGGGSSVLAADQCAKAGLDVIPLPPEYREELKNRGISVWDWLSNPADFTIREDDRLSIGIVLELMAQNPNFDLLITTMGIWFGRQPGMAIGDYLKQQYRLDACRVKPFLAVVAESGLGIEDWDSQEWKGNCELRTELISLGIPFFPTIGRAALAARKVFDYYRQR